MKNSVLIIIVICISAFAKAQTTKVLDTIYANDTKNCSSQNLLGKVLLVQIILYLLTIVKKNSILDFFRQSLGRKVICW